jgi:hypothetical protein
MFGLPVTVHYSSHTAFASAGATTVIMPRPPSSKPRWLAALCVRAGYRVASGMPWGTTCAVVPSAVRRFLFGSLAGQAMIMAAADPLTQPGELAARRLW